MERMVKRMFVLAMLVGICVTVNAQVLFYTDFRTTPEGFKAASAVATAKNGGEGADDTIAMGVDGPKDTVIDGCTLAVTKAGNVIVISKASQSYVKVGDTAGCTAGRLGLKQTGCSIKFPSVTGPCTITYYAAGSSASGKSISLMENDADIPEAGFADLAIEGVQATRKMIYPSSVEGPTVFKLVGNAGVYLYDVKIEAGMASVINNRSVKTQRINWTKDKLVINTQSEEIDFYNIAGKKIMRSKESVINVSGFSKGIYVARVVGTREKYKIAR
jgi:hypothetical protein